LKKFKFENDATTKEEIDPKLKIKNIVESVFDTHYDDIIAKKLPVKFKVRITISQNIITKKIVHKCPKR